MKPVGVLLMAYGGPSSLEDLPGYLADIRRGRPTPRKLLDEITENYRSIGGRSPLGEWTHRQASAVSTVLNANAEGRYAVYVGMRHWHPWIGETVGEMLDAGIERAISVALAPHFSAMSVAAYQASIAAGLGSYRGEMSLAHVDSFHSAPLLVEAFAERVHQALVRWPEEERESVHVIFTAHSLPGRIIADGDPYDAQVRETARLVALRAGLRAEQWSSCYQSAGRTPEPWLGPSLPEHLAAIAARGIRSAAVVPVGFVCDHVEILYDIDVDAQHVAAGFGMRLERPSSLNDDPIFTTLLVELIRERGVKAGWIT